MKNIQISTGTEPRESPDSQNIGEVHFFQEEAATTPIRPIARCPTFACILNVQQNAYTDLIFFCAQANSVSNGVVVRHTILTF